MLEVITGPAGFETFDKTIGSARQLGSLDASTIWALLCVLLLGYIFWRDKQRHIMEEKWQKVRSDEAAAELLAAHALQKIADALEKLETVVDERLPRR